MNVLKDLISHIKGNNREENKNDRIIRKFEELIRKTDKKDIKLNEIFSHFSNDNILNFQKILNIFNDELNENDTLESLTLLVKELEQLTSNRMGEDNCIISDLKLRFQIHDILIKLINFIDSGYLSIEDGEIKCLDLTLSPDNGGQFKKTVVNSLTKGCDGLIDKHGNFYFSYFEHEYMVQYLMALSIDLTNALRVHQSHYNKKFALSSFFHYYSKGVSNEVFKEDENLALSKKQLETLRKIITLYHIDKDYILSVLKSSINLGFDFLSTSVYSGSGTFNYNIASHNIKQFSSVFEDVDFSDFYDKIVDKARYLNGANMIIDD